MVDLNDLQGLTIQPYRYRRVRYLFFHSAETSSAKGFLQDLLDSVRFGIVSLDENSPSLTNVALTATGLAAAGIAVADLAQFDLSFRNGPDPQLTGDVPASASGLSNWWEKQFGQKQIDVMVMVHAKEAAALEERTGQVLDMALKHGLFELFPRGDGTRLDGEALKSGRLHFGYKDGISQPDVSWTDPIDAGKVDYRNFVVGYATDDVFSSPGHGAVADLARNSSYLVLRWIYQDVARFQLFLQGEGKLLAARLALDQAHAEELLAAKMLGRWRDGTPLELSPDGPSDLIPNDAVFDYGQDQSGLICPVSAHVRLVNPRNEKLNAAVQMEGVPRVIRRGIPYGPEIDAGQTQDDGVDRGIIGVFLCASILRQFYKLTQWISHNDFSPVFANPHTQDPLFGNRAIENALPEFTIPLKTGAAHKISALPDFVRTKGTEFFILPSKGMLQRLAQPAKQPAA